MASDREIARIQRQAAEASRKMAESARQSPMGPAKSSRSSGGGVTAAPKVKPGPDPTFDSTNTPTAIPLPVADAAGRSAQDLLETYQGAGPKRR